MEKKKFYRRLYRPLVVPADPAQPIREASVPEPFGALMSGTETVRVIDGREVIVVKLQDGTEALLSELTVTEMIERRKHPRDLA